MIPLYQILIRRDANTITPVTVPEYEVPLLQELFGTENVHNSERIRVDEVGPGSPIGSIKASDDEYERCSAKYGVELVEQVFGKKSSQTLQKAVIEATQATQKKPKPTETKKPKPTETEQEDPAQD